MKRNKQEFYSIKSFYDCRWHVDKDLLYEAGEKQMSKREEAGEIFAKCYFQVVQKNMTIGFDNIIKMKKLYDEIIEEKDKEIKELNRRLKTSKSENLKTIKYYDQGDVFEILEMCKRDTSFQCTILCSYFQGFNQDKTKIKCSYRIEG